MLRYLLDTNLCNRVLHNRPAGLRARFNAEASGLAPIGSRGMIVVTGNLRALNRVEGLRPEDWLAEAR